MKEFTATALQGLNILGSLFLFFIALFLLVVFVLFILDVTQTKDAVRRNYPVIGRFRKLFSSLGEFFRQYFFALDREEMPFNRAERDWISEVCEHGSGTVPFGSTRNLTAGAAIFANGMFPKQEGEHIEKERPSATKFHHFFHWISQKIQFYSEISTDTVNDRIIGGISPSQNLGKSTHRSRGEMLND